ncbi:MAG: hypothetical protein ACI807_003608 [Paracoccaceae bacterium]|jgi:hypothetical protein
MPSADLQQDCRPPGVPRAGVADGEGTEHRIGRQRQNVMVAAERDGDLFGALKARLDQVGDQKASAETSPIRRIAMCGCGRRWAIWPRSRGEVRPRGFHPCRHVPRQRRSTSQTCRCAAGSCMRRTRKALAQCGSFPRMAAYMGGLRHGLLNRGGCGRASGGQVGGGGVVWRFADAHHDLFARKADAVLFKRLVHALIHLFA